MKVVHIVRQYPPSIGGLEDAVSNLCRALSKIHGVEVSVITLDRLFSAPKDKLPVREVVDGIDVIRVPFVGSRRYPIAPAVLGHLKGADIIHVHAIDFFFDFLAATRFLHRKILVASTHGGFFHTTFAARLKEIYFGTVTRLSCMAYRALCASSDNDARTFRRIAGSKVVAIENGVNTEKWAEAGSPVPKRAMIAIGRWSENKRVPLLISLVGRLRQKEPSWKLLIAGVPDMETKESLARAAKAEGAEESVEIFEKPDDAKIKELLSEASYIASASAYEGFGITAIEGLSAGLYPILSAIPPFEKIRKLLGSSLTIDPDRIDLCARNIEDFHKASITSIKNYADQRRKCLLLSQKYLWTNTGRQVMAVYRNVLEGRGP